MIGFDYGTSNCAVGALINGKPELVSLGDEGKLLPSTLYSPDRNIISHWLLSHLPENEKIPFSKSRTNQIQRGKRISRELLFDGIDTELSFGKEALLKYLDEPEEGYYIKSPKSFLGASGLLPVQVDLFEDIVASMMLNVKRLSEVSLKQKISDVVIGRPINFQGVNESASNKQAIDILTRAAKRVGYKNIEFQFEPVAAGFAFEATMTEDKKVLVVDIGGGTTDCSMLLMGPRYSNKIDRTEHLLSHSGVRIGGNDLDIQLAYKALMPSFGMNDLMKNGQPMPITQFKQAVSTNSIKDQSEFYSASNRRTIEQLIRDAKSPEIISRLLRIHDDKLSYQLVNAAEQAKIALSDNEIESIELPEIEEYLNIETSKSLLKASIKKQLSKITLLMDEAILEANCKPDIIFVTGGTAKSPIIFDHINKHIPETPVIIGDNFGSVTLGLTRWAEKIFK